eukprot:379981_1
MSTFLVIILSLIQNIITINSSTFHFTTELYANYHTCGVTVTFNTTTFNETDILSYYRHENSSKWILAHSFSPIVTQNNRYATSIIDLKPGNTYEIRVELKELPQQNTIHSVATRNETDIIQNTFINILFVSNESIDNTQCSNINPCTLLSALQIANPGDQILLKNGIYYSSFGGINMYRSGNTTHRISIKGESRNGVIIDGSYPYNYSWISVSNNIWKSSVSISVDVYNVVINGKRLYKYQCISGCFYPFGSRYERGGGFLAGFALDNIVSGIVYIYLPNGMNPNHYISSISICDKFFLFYQSSYITLSTMTIRNFGAGQYRMTVWNYNGKYNAVRNINFIHDDLPITWSGKSTGFVIEKCSFKDTKYDWEYNAIKEPIYPETGAIIGQKASNSRGIIFRRNIIDGYADCIGMASTTSAYIETAEFDFYENIISHCAGDGIEADGRCPNCRIFDNIIQYVLNGISLTPLYDGPLFMFRNVIYNIGRMYSIDGYVGNGLKVNSGTTWDHNVRGYFYNNLIYDDGLSQYGKQFGIVIFPLYGSCILKLRNNIIHASKASLSYGSGVTSTSPVVDWIDFDYDALNIGSFGIVVYYVNDIYNRTDDIFNNMGIWEHSIVTNPVYIDPNNLNFRMNYNVSDNMLLKGNGVIIPGFTSDNPNFGPYQTSTIINELPSTTSMISIETSTTMSTSDILSTTIDGDSAMFFPHLIVTDVNCFH